MRKAWKQGDVLQQILQLGDSPSYPPSCPVLIGVAFCISLPSA